MAPGLSRGGRAELAAGLLVLAAVVSAGVALAARRNAPIEPGLVVEPRDLDFGTVWEQPAYRHTFVVTNPTEASVRVTEIRTGCGCTKVEPASFTILPGDTQVLTAEIDLAEGMDGLAERHFAVELRPVAVGRQTPLVWRLRGLVRSSSMVVTPREVLIVDSFDLDQAASTDAALSVVLPFGSPIDGLAARVSDPRLAAVSIARIDSKAFQISISPSSSPGTRIFHVDVIGHVQGAVSGPVRRIPVTVHMLGDYSADPERLDLGASRIGSFATAVVTLTRRGGKPFDVETFHGDGLTVQPLEAEPCCPFRRKFRVSRQIANIGDDQRTARFRLHPLGGGGEIQELSVDVASYGLPAGS